MAMAIVQLPILWFRMLQYKKVENEVLNMNKAQKLAKKEASRLTKDLELQLKRGLVHVELVDASEVEGILAEEA